MVTKKSVEDQLKEIHFNLHSWGRTEVAELPNVILPEEKIYECVNGFYEGGFALLVATDLRVLLVDKKPLNFLTVEDLRFDLINEIDYSHRLLGARISISAGQKNLIFTSFNQPRLRKLISHVQHCMAESKQKQTDNQQHQNSHLEQINQQLQAYLIAQHSQQEQLRQQLDKPAQNGDKSSTNEPSAELPEPVKPSAELADYLYAQQLLAQYQQSGGLIKPMAAAEQPEAKQPPSKSEAIDEKQAEVDMYEAARQEIFGKNVQSVATDTKQPSAGEATASSQAATENSKSPEINPLRIAYSKLPLALRNRKFGSPSFHAHSQASQPAGGLGQLHT